jgi:hypothetical protein
MTPLATIPRLELAEVRSPGAAPPPAAVDRLAAAGIEPALVIEDWARAFSCSRREIERMRSAGKLPKPDFYVGRRSPRWLAETVRAFIERGCRP